MNWWRRLRRRGQAEDDLDRELRDHVERQVADHVRAGMPPREARRRARVEFGGLDQIKELCRDARGTRWIEETWQDVRFAVRLLAKDRWAAAGAVLTLGSAAEARDGCSVAGTRRLLSLNYMKYSNYHADLQHIPTPGHQERAPESMVARGFTGPDLSGTPAASPASTRRASRNRPGAASGPGAGSARPSRPLPR